MADRACRGSGGARFEASSARNGANGYVMLPSGNTHAERLRKRSNFIELAHLRRPAAGGCEHLLHQP